MEVLKKIGKFILLPLTAILGVLIIVKEFVIGDSTDKIVDDSRKKDIQLKEKADKADALAEEHRRRADEIKDKKDAITDDPDWDV